MGIEMLLVFVGVVLLAGMLIAGLFAYDRIHLDGHEVRIADVEEEPAERASVLVPSLALAAAGVDAREVVSRLQLHVLTEMAAADRFLAQPTVENLYQSNPNAFAN